MGEKIEKTILIILAILFLTAQVKADQKPTSPSAVKKTVMIIHRAEHIEIENHRVESAIKSFRNYCGDSMFVKYMKGTVLSQDSVYRGVKNMRPDLIWLVNTHTPERYNFITDIPVIHSLGFIRFPLGNNFTRISIHVPPALQLPKLQKAFPTIKRVGLFHSPYTEWIADEAREVARKAGIELYTVRLTDKNQLNQLDAEFEKMFLKKMIQGFWMIADPVLYYHGDDKKTNAFVERAGAMGVCILSSYMDNLFEGALISVETDYPALGKQAWEMADKILYDGVAVKDVPMEYPREVRTSISLLVLKKVILRSAFNPAFFEDRVFALGAHETDTTCAQINAPT